MGEGGEVSGDDSRVKYDHPEPMVTLLTQFSPCASGNAYGTILDLRAHAGNISAATGPIAAALALIPVSAPVLSATL
jgi:hypothetical protein